MMGGGAPGRSPEPGRDPRNRLRLPALYLLGLGAVPDRGVLLSPGLPQLVMIGLGLMIGAGFSGPAGAVVADVTHAHPRHGACNPDTGQQHTGPRARPGVDRLGSRPDQFAGTALQLVPLIAVLAAVAFAVGSMFCRIVFACMATLRFWIGAEVATCYGEDERKGAGMSSGKEKPATLLW